MSGLTDQAETVLVQLDTPAVSQPETVLPKRKRHQRLSRVQINAILSLTEAGQTLREVGAAIGCSHQTVSDVLHDFQDTRVLARKRLKAGSLELAERVIRKARPKEAVQVLEDLRVLTPAQPGPSGNQVNVLVLGGGSVPIDLPVTQALSPMSEALTVTAIPVSAAQREAKVAEKLKD